MKKRLISMLMAVLMIASLLPAACFRCLCGSGGGGTGYS